MTPRTLTIPGADIDDLRARLARTRLPDQAPGAPWAAGTDVDYMAHAATGAPSPPRASPSTIPKR